MNKFRVQIFCFALQIVVQCRKKGCCSKFVQLKSVLAHCKFMAAIYMDLETLCCQIMLDNTIGLCLWSLVKTPVFGTMCFLARSLNVAPSQIRSEIGKSRGCQILQNSWENYGRKICQHCPNDHLTHPFEG